MHHSDSVEQQQRL